MLNPPPAENANNNVCTPETSAWFVLSAGKSDQQKVEELVKCRFLLSLCVTRFHIPYNSTHPWATLYGMKPSCFASMQQFHSEGKACTVTPSLFFAVLRSVKNIASLHHLRDLCVMCFYFNLDRGSPVLRYPYFTKEGGSSTRRENPS